jgi:hypothetical protein
VVVVVVVVVRALQTLPLLFLLLTVISTQLLLSLGSDISILLYLQEGSLKEARKEGSFS